MELVEIKNIDQLDKENAVLYQKKYIADVIVKDDNNQFLKFQINFLIELTAIGQAAHLTVFDENYAVLKDSIIQKLNKFDFENI